MFLDPGICRASYFELLQDADVQTFKPTNSTNYFDLSNLSIVQYTGKVAHTEKGELMILDLDTMEVE